MKFTLSWLKDHLDTNKDLDTIVDTLTNIGLEIESVEDKSKDFSHKKLLEKIPTRAVLVNNSNDFTYVEDTARGILLAGITDEAVGQTINIGSNYEMTVRELAETIKQVVELDDAKIIYDEPRPGDILRLYADSSKAGQLLGFEPIFFLGSNDWFQSVMSSRSHM